MNAINNYGTDAVVAITKYGDDAVKAMKNSIEPGLLSKLDDLGIKPSDFEKYGIGSKEAAEKVAEALANGKVVKV